ncbi:MAG: phosphoglycerate dehydrogenase [Bacteroidetes bacterium]|nr:MAG: phosphoglycerate dehydrogenase [Bacteroidota bacterium]TAG86888.1 MAG: phosphoglycerate dehydrogenase [Bacteroidota bacterium]
MIKKKILIIDDMHLSILPLLEKLDFEVVYLPDIQRNEIFLELKDIFGIIIRSKTKIDEEFLNHAQKLAFVARAGAGLDLIDVDLAKKKNIHLLNAPEGNRDAVAEHTLGLLLNVLNKINLSDKEIRNKIWQREKNRGFEIKNKTIGIIGFGNIGQQVAQRLSSFECKILAYDKNKKDFSNTKAKEATLLEIFEQTDILTLHIPLDKENFGWINKDFLARFKKPIWLINTARGEILSLEALIEGLESGKIIGAGLDVLENEKLNTLSVSQQKNFEYLSHSHQVILTPHVAGWTYESYQRINEVLVEKIDNLMKEKFSP